MGAANLVSAPTARRYRAVPVGYVDEDAAAGDGRPGQRARDRRHPDDDRPQLPTSRSPPPSDIDALVSRLNTLETAVTEAVDEDEEAELGADVTELRESADDAPVIKLVYSILGQAVDEGASDIHFEPEEKDMRVRFRVDGVLYEAARVPKRMVAGVVSPDQDHERPRHRREAGPAGRARHASTSTSSKVDLRVVTLPTQRGEGATIRILDKAQALRSLDDLGMDGERPRALRVGVPPVLRRGARHRPDRLGQVDHALRGAQRAQRGRASNIITIEDPVEYRIDGRQPDRRQPARPG